MYIKQSTRQYALIITANITTSLGYLHGLPHLFLKAYEIGTNTIPSSQRGKLRLSKSKVTCPRQTKGSKVRMTPLLP